MKKSFINPAVRVIKFESNIICGSGDTVPVDSTGSNVGPDKAPSRPSIFGDSEF